MTRKIACALAFLFGTLPLSALAQQQSGAPKPTKKVARAPAVRKTSPRGKG